MAEGDDPTRGARLGLTGLIVTVVCAAVTGWLALTTRSFLVAGAAAHLVVGSWVWLGLLLYERRRQRAHDEEVETRRLTALAREGRRALFDAQAVQHSEATAAVARFRKVGFPVLAVGVSALEGLLVWGLLRFFPHEAVQPSLIAAAVLCGFAFGLLVLGRYAFALARAGLLNAGAGGRRAVSGAVVAFLAGLGSAIHSSWGLSQVDLLGYAFVVLGGLLALEALLLLLLEAYRPRRTGERVRPPFDSRLLGILATPGDLARSIARAVDYQFGFSISQTWFYRFLERWVAPLIGFTVLAFWLLSAFVVIPAHEQGVLRRLGKTQEELLAPGLHVKWPWPISRVQRLATRRIHTILTGEHTDRSHENPAFRERALLWTDAEAVDDGHGHEDAGHDLVLVPRRVAGAGKGVVPVSLLTVAASVTYQIGELKTYLADVRDPPRLLRLLAERELCFLLSGEDLDLLLRQRGEHGAALARRLQTAADRFQLGLRVHSAALTDMHPPSEIGAAFEQPTVARERRQVRVLEARVFEARQRQRSAAKATWILQDADLLGKARAGLAKADAARFKGLRALDRAAPGVFRTSRLLEELVEGAAGKRIVVIGRRGQVVTDLNLQEKLSADDIQMGQEFRPRAKQGASSEKR